MLIVNTLIPTTFFPVMGGLDVSLPSGYPSKFFNRDELTPSETVTSNKIQIPSGTSGAVTVSTGTFSINNEAFGTTGSVVEGATLQLQADASALYETAVVVTVAIGGVEYGTWTLTTRLEIVIATRYTDTDHYTEADHYE